MDILDSFDLTRNFWDVNTGFGIVKEFQEFRKSDKSKNKALSSKTMWAIALLVHTKSKFANLQYEDRLKLINDDFLTEKDSLDPEDKHISLVEDFQRLGMTRTQRVSRQWGDKLDERFKFIDSVPYTLDNVETLDKVMANTDKLWKHYITCLKDLEDEAASTQVMGGAAESLSEQNRI